MRRNKIERNIGKKVGMLTIIKDMGLAYNGAGYRRVLCKCDCGKITTITSALIFNGKQKSCGCHLKNKPKTHGFSSKLNKEKYSFYKLYKTIEDRCNKPTQISYKTYGGKGIMCLWNSFEEFRDDMYESYLEHIEKHGKKQTTIDRIDNDGNYCKENCRWATYKEQQNNRTNNNKLTINGVTKNIGEWQKYYNISRSTYRNRVKNGMNKIDALTKKPHDRVKIIKFNGKTQSLNARAKELGIHRSKIYRKIFMENKDINTVFNEFIAK